MASRKGKNAPEASDSEMSEDDQTIEDCGSSAEEESKTRSLQPLKAKLPSSFEEKQKAPRIFIILEAA